VLLPACAGGTLGSGCAFLASCGMNYEKFHCFILEKYSVGRPNLERKSLNRHRLLGEVGIFLLFFAHSVGRPWILRVIIKFLPISRGLLVSGPRGKCLPRNTSKSPPRRTEVEENHHKEAYFLKCGPMHTIRVETGRRGAENVIRRCTWLTCSTIEDAQATFNEPDPPAHAPRQN
jgi:hypothetical protein